MVNGKAYIGKANNVKRRWEKHCVAARNESDGLLYRAMRKYGIENFQMRVIDEAEDEAYALNTLEPLWIRRFREEGIELYNLTEGGEGIVGLVHSEETKQKMSESLRGKKRSEEQRQRLSEANRGKSPSEEARRKISEANRGRSKPPRSEQHLRKLREAALARGSMSEEQKRKISESMRQSENVGHPIDEETRARIAEKLRGQVQSEETKAKRAESMRKAWERRRIAQSQANLENYSSSSETATI